MCSLSLVLPSPLLHGTFLGILSWKNVMSFLLKIKYLRTTLFVNKTFQCFTSQSGQVLLMRTGIFLPLLHWAHLYSKTLMYGVSRGERSENCFSRMLKFNLLKLLMPAVWMITTAYSLSLIRLRKRGNIMIIIFSFREFNGYKHLRKHICTGYISLTLC